MRVNWRLNWRGWSTLQWALIASAAVHGVLLTVRFVDPQAINRAFKDTPLEVILVNAKGNERPEKAQAIAQACRERPTFEPGTAFAYSSVGTMLLAYPALSGQFLVNIYSDHSSPGDTQCVETFVKSARDAGFPTLAGLTSPFTYQA